MTKNVKKRLTEKIQKESAEWLDQQPAWLGDYSETVLTDTAGVLYARLINGKVVKVFNSVHVAPDFDQLVIIGRSRTLPNLWQIIRVRETYVDPSTGGRIDYHHEQHEEDGPDRLNLDEKQILQFTVRVSDGANFIVKVGGRVFTSATGLAQIDTQLRDLSSYVVTAGAKYLTIETDNTGALSENNTGANFGSPVLAALSYVPSPSAGKHTLAYILLYEGQTELLDSHIRIVTPVSFNLDGFLTEVNWGDLGGTLSDQADLQAALDAKLEDAPADGQQYARKDNAWDVVSGSSGGGGRVLIMATGITNPPVPVQNAEGTNWIYSTD